MPSEIVNLTWDDIDWVAGQVRESGWGNCLGQVLERIAGELRNGPDGQIRPASCVRVDRQ